MAPKRSQNTSQAKSASRSKAQPAGKAKAAPKSKGSKPAAKSVAVPRSAPRTPRTPVKKAKPTEPDTCTKATPFRLPPPAFTPAPFSPPLYHDVEAEVRLRASYATKEAELDQAWRKAQEMESVAQAERSRALEAEKRAAAAEAFLQELRERASRAEALQLEVAQAQARAAHAEAKAEVLSEMQESFQRNIPEMVRSIAETMMECSNRRRNQRSLPCNAPFRGVKPKLELEDGPSDALPLVPVGMVEELNGYDKTSDELLKLCGQGGTEEIPSSADTNPSQSSKATSRLKDGVAGVFKRAFRSA